MTSNIRPSTTVELPRGEYFTLILSTTKIPRSITVQYDIAKAERRTRTAKLNERLDRSREGD